MKIYEDLRVVQSRIGVLQYLVLTLVGLLVAAFWYVQVLRGRHYRALAENNRSRIVPIAAPRGPLLDRDGEILVENRASFNIVMNPEDSSDLDETISRLGRVLRLGEALVRERLARRAPLRPVLVKADASLEDVAAIAARRLELPEVGVEVVPLRSYRLAAAAAHALGQVGEVTDEQLKLPGFQDLKPGDLVGQAGLEASYNRDLMGKDGMRRVIVNSRGLEVAEAERVAPLVGPTVTLTLDADLQRAAEHAFAGRAGSAVALDPVTGEILAMTSLPAYDPNQFSTGVEAGLWHRLRTDPETPLLNRVIQGQYAPGSLFKIIMAVAGLEEGLVSPQSAVYCPGYLSIYGTVFRCNKVSGHGMVNLHRALAQSCNVYFYQLGVKLEIERIARYARLMGLGSATGVDLPHELPGLVPSPEWKQRAQKAPWYPGETVSVAIGQGQLTVTPMQMARLAAFVANGGRLVRPHLVRVVGEAPVPQPEPGGPGLKPGALEAVRRGLWAAVNEQGTGWRSRLPGWDVCGKTGTAQVVTHARLARGGQVAALQPHGWFVAFAPLDDPKIALAVLVEHGGSGAEAAPVAREMLARFFQSAPGPRIAGAVSGPLVEED